MLQKSTKYGFFFWEGGISFCGRGGFSFCKWVAVHVRDMWYRTEASNTKWKSDRARTGTLSALEIVASL